MTRYHFSPTPLSRENLIREGKKPETVYVTGNTVIDALQTTVRKDYTHPELEWASDSRLIIITAHADSHSRIALYSGRAYCKAVYIESTSSE